METVTVRNLYEIKQGDTLYWFGNLRSVVLENEPIGYGQWRITLSPEGTDQIITATAPGGWLLRTI